MVYGVVPCCTSVQDVTRLKTVENMFQVRSTELRTVLTFKRVNPYYPYRIPCRSSLSSLRLQEKSILILYNISCRVWSVLCNTEYKARSTKHGVQSTGLRGLLCVSVCQYV